MQLTPIIAIHMSAAVAAYAIGPVDDGGSLLIAFRVLANRESGAHRQTMQYLYIGACIVAGAFTLLPSRYLGRLIWHGWLK